MTLLLLNDRWFSTKTYAKQLKRWGITLIDHHCDLSTAEWDGQYPSDRWLSDLMVTTYKEYEFSIDAVQILFVSVV